MTVAQNEYKTLKHDKVSALLHWQWCKLMDSRRMRNNMNTVENEIIVFENDEVKILWDFSIQTETKIDHNKPDLICLKKKKI